jgi:hypothetical protein
VTPVGVALGRLRRLGAAAEPARWQHWVIEMERTGRVTLPAAARCVAEGLTVLRATSRDDALVLRRDGLGAPTQLDGRGRLLVPVWLRRAAERTRSVLVAARRPDAAVVVIAPTSVLDGAVDELCGEVA